MADFKMSDSTFVVMTRLYILPVSIGRGGMAVFERGTHLLTMANKTHVGLPHIGYLLVLLATKDI